MSSEPLTRWRVEWHPTKDMERLMDDGYDVAEAAIDAEKAAGLPTERRAMALARAVADDDFYGCARVQKQLGHVCQEPADKHNCTAVQRCGQWIEWENDGEVVEVDAKP